MIAPLLALLLLAQSNPSVGSFNGMEPSQGTAVGAKDPNGRMQPIRVDNTGALITSSGGGAGGNVIVTGGNIVVTNMIDLAGTCTLTALAPTCDVSMNGQGTIIFTIGEASAAVCVPNNPGVDNVAVWGVSNLIGLGEMEHTLVGQHVGAPVDSFNVSGGIGILDYYTLSVNGTAALEKVRFTATIATPGCEPAVSWRTSTLVANRVNQAVAGHNEEANADQNTFLRIGGTGTNGLNPTSFGLAVNSSGMASAGIPPVSASGTIDNDGDVVAINLAGNTAVEAHVTNVTACSLETDYLSADDVTWVVFGRALQPASWAPVGTDPISTESFLIPVPPGAQSVRVRCVGAYLGVAPYGSVVTMRATHTPTPPPYIDSNGVVSIAGAVGITGTLRTESEGVDGGTPPGWHTMMGWNDGGVSTPVSTAKPLPITGTISASNPSVSATGAAVPAQATYAGVLSGGNLVGLAQPVTDTQLSARVNTLGQKTMANSTPVVLSSDQSAISTFNGTIDANNSSTATLGAGAAFTGTATDTFNFASFVVQVVSNVSSAANGVSLQFSNDGTNWDEIEARTFTAGGNALNIQGSLRARYFRIVYTNGGTIQASFRLQTLFKTGAVAGDVTEVVDPVLIGEHAQIVRAVLGAKNAAGTAVADLTQATTTPAGTEPGLIVRPIPSGTQTVSGTVTANAGTGTMAVSGPLTDAQLRATPVPVSGTVTANLGTIAGVATETTLSAINTKTPALGQTTMAGSVPVAIASNQSAVPVSGTVTANAGTGTFATSSTQLPAALGPALATAALSVTTSTVATAIDAGTCTNVTASATILASNTARKVAIVKNNGTAAVHVKLGATATTANPPLPAGQSLVIDGPSVYSGVIDVIASTGTQSVCAYSW